MNHISLKIPLLLGSLLFSAAYAQTSAPEPVLSAPAATDALTLTQILERLRQSPSWRSADLSYRAAELQLQSARTRAGLNVQVGANASLSKYPWDGGDWRISPALTASFAVPVLPWSPQREAVRGAERALGAAAIELRSARAGLTLQAAQAYASARSAAASAALAAQQLALAQAALAVAQSQREQNLIPQTALLDRQAGVEQARAAAEQATRGLELAAAQLTRLLGQPAPLPTRAADYVPVTALVPAGVLTDSLDALLTRARAQRPELARAAAALADAQAALAAAQLDQRVPDLTAAVQVGQFAATGGRTLSGNFGLKTGTVSGQVNFPLREPTTTVTAPGPDGVPVPSEVALPSGVALSVGGTVQVLGSVRAQATAQAEAGVAQATLALQSAAQAAELDVRARFADLSAARDTLTALQTVQTRAERALAEARARLEAGVGTALEVQQATLALAQAQSNLSAAEAQVALAALQLAQATGDLDPLLVSP